MRGYGETLATETALTWRETPQLAQELDGARQLGDHPRQYIWGSCPGSTTSRLTILQSAAISDIPSALRWLRSTFLFVRIIKNPTFYAIPGIKTTPEARLEELCLEAIKELVGSGVVDEDGDKLAANRQSTDLPYRFARPDMSFARRLWRCTCTAVRPFVCYGSHPRPQIMAKFYISHKTFLAIKELPIGANMRTLLETLCSSAELGSFRFRQGEKSVRWVEIQAY